MKGTVPIALASALWQTLNPSPRATITAARPLQQAEVAAVLAAARQAVAGRTVRLSYAPDGPGPDVLFGADGRPRIMRTISGWSGGIIGGDGRSTTTHVDVVTVTEYTGRAARGCDGATRAGDLLVEYVNENGTGWKTTARTTTAHEIAAPIFDILAGTRSVESGEIKALGDRTARGFVAPFAPPADLEIGNPLPAGTTQTLWIDVESLRPLKWAIAIPAAPERGIPAIPSYGLMFTYDLSPEPRIPEGVTPPDCIR